VTSQPPAFQFPQTSVPHGRIADPPSQNQGSVTVSSQPSGCAEPWPVAAASVRDGVPAWMRRAEAACARASGRGRPIRGVRGRRGHGAHTRHRSNSKQKLQTCASLLRAAPLVKQTSRLGGRRFACPSVRHGHHLLLRAFSPVTSSGLAPCFV
jgi:hypothetical protein